MTQALQERADGLLPQGDELALDRRQHELLADAQQSLERATRLDDSVLIAE